MTSRCSLRVAVPLLAAGLAVGGCTTLPPVSPAPPPGTAEHQESAEEWVGVDGYIEVQQGKRARDAGFVAIRNYCGGDFEVVREKTRTTMTVLSFPFPYDVNRIFFRCGAVKQQGAVVE